MSSEEKLMSSSLNGITAYEDDNEKRISNLDIIKYVKKNNPDSITRVLKIVNDNLEQIKGFINNIPYDYNDIVIMSEIRKDYYIKTLEIRLSKLKEESI